MLTLIRKAKVYRKTNSDDLHLSHMFCLSFSTFQCNIHKAHGVNYIFILLETKSVTDYRHLPFFNFLWIENYSSNTTYPLDALMSSLVYDNGEKIFSGHIEVLLRWYNYEYYMHHFIIQMQ